LREQRFELAALAAAKLGSLVISRSPIRRSRPLAWCRNASDGAG
jgi:hypothetical protein